MLYVVYNIQVTAQTVYYASPDRFLRDMPLIMNRTINNPAQYRRNIGLVASQQGPEIIGITTVSSLPY